jgi:hypothetical protein
MHPRRRENCLGRRQRGGSAGSSRGRHVPTMTGRYFSAPRIGRWRTWGVAASENLEFADLQFQYNGVAARRSGLVFCKHDGSQLMQRDILKYSLHPILKKHALEQGGLNIFRRFRITAMETAEVLQALQHTWCGRARTHVSEVYKEPLKQREWRLGWAERAGMGFSLPERKKPRNAQLIEFRRGWVSC